MRLTAVTLGVAGAVRDLVVVRVCLRTVRFDPRKLKIGMDAYAIGAAVCAEVCRQRNGSAEAEENAETV